MLDRLIRNLTLDLIAEAVRHPDPVVRAQLAEAFWDLHYLYRFGLPQVPGLELLHPPRPRPEPLPNDRLHVHEDVLFSLANAVLNDAEPRPATPNIVSVLGDKSLQLAGALRLSNRLVAAKNLLSEEIARLHASVFAENNIERIPFSVAGVDIAATSQGNNLNQEKVNIAWRQALSLWSAVAPIEFQPLLAGQEPLLRIHFVRDGTTQLAGGAEGFISYPQTSPPHSATIYIYCDNDFFVDRFLEPVRHPTGNGPFDLILVLAHEIGHALGLNHPPTETEPCIMSDSKGSGTVRQLFPYDIREVQRLHRAINLAAPATAHLAETGQLIDASPGVELQRGPFGLLVFGPMETSALVDVLVPAKGRLINALRLRFTTITASVFVNRVETFDGIIPLQQFALSARASGEEGLAGHPWDMLLGFLHRPSMANDMLVRMELRFTNRGAQPQADFGVMQLHEVTAETLQRPLEVFGFDSRLVQPSL